ncbi:3-keto-disaccharide hydrolase [Streptomyces tendae]|uniref:3-keto-disaccharide hydrolase n=1 Tax=Streptomyces tendae TaxID=1932 RepID=UPI001F0EA698|nr:DUF1080 domain-containing protein [Streptomyces tendae]
MGLFWFDREITGDYSLKLDWKLHGDDNSGVFLGFPASDDPWSAVDNGYEIQIDAPTRRPHHTGAVYGFRSADVAARDAALNRRGSGTPTNSVSPRAPGDLPQRPEDQRLHHTDPARSLRQGHIGLQNHGDGDEASFRNVRLQRDGATPAPVPVR